MNIKNYTTEVPARTSLERIEGLLVDFGATNIMKEFEGGNCRAISFRVLIENVPFAFKLPGDVKACYLWLKKKSPSRQDKWLLEQAERIAWKHQFEWLHIQLTGIELAQLEKMQALLPYVVDNYSGESFYKKLKDGKFQNLLSNGSHQ